MIPASSLSLPSHCETGTISVHRESGSAIRACGGPVVRPPTIARNFASGDAIMRRSPLILASVLVGLAFLVPLTPVHGQQPPAQAKPANLKVLMPDADAALLIQNKPTQLRGLERTFVSPPLKTGQKYVYTVVAKWEPNNYTKITRTRKFDV